MLRNSARRLGALVAKFSHYLAQTVAHHDNSVISGYQILPGSSNNWPHGFLNAGVLHRKPCNTRIGFSAFLGRSVHQVVVVLILYGAERARNNFAMNAFTVQAGLALFGGQRTFRMIVVAPGPAVFVIDWNPEVAVLRVIGAGWDHGKARHHPLSDAPIILAFLGVPADADIQSAIRLRNVEHRFQIVQIVLVGLGALEQRISLEFVGMQERHMTGIDTAFQRL